MRKLCECKVTVASCGYSKPKLKNKDGKIGELFFFNMPFEIVF